MNLVDLKRCSKCGGEFPATTEYFHAHKGSPDKLNYYCKDCSIKLSREYYKSHRDQQKLTTKAWEINNFIRRSATNMYRAAHKRAKDKALSFELNSDIIELWINNTI